MRRSSFRVPERRETQIVEYPISGDIALQSRARGLRPNEFRHGDSVDCPFCPGAELQTPEEIASILDGSGAELDDFTAWRGGQSAAWDPHGPPGASHWHADLVPRESTFAGFELASGLHITTGAPEESAELWRRMMA